MSDLVEEVVSLPGGEALTVMRPRDAEALLDEAAFARDEFLPYWAELWPSGIALARELAGRSLRGARVVELGCGLGLPSIVAARCGARVLATDWSADALELLRRNATANGAQVRTLHVDWAQPQDLLDCAPFDLVLGADVLYEQRDIEVVAGLLARLSARAWIADPGRPALGDFLARVEQAGWRPTAVARDGATIHRLERAAVPDR